MGPDSLTAAIYANPLSLAIGGIAAVILELAEPRVRHGVWDHSVFPTDPVLRLRRTGLAAMVTFYAAKSQALGMIAGINRRHRDVFGLTEGGECYNASDPELLAWVQTTAAYGFIQAYARFVRGLTEAQWAEALREARPVAMAYGVRSPDASYDEVKDRIGAMLPRLEPSSTLDKFLRMMRKTPFLPGPASIAQPTLVRAAVSLLPPPVAAKLELHGAGLHRGEGRILRLAAGSVGLLSLRNHPRNLARQRLAKASGLS